MRQTYLMLTLIVFVVLTAHFAKLSHANEVEQRAIAEGSPAENDPGDDGDDDTRDNMRTAGVQ